MQPSQTEAPADASSSLLPPAVTTRHVLEAADRRLAFSATAGALTLAGDDGEPAAEIAYVAYALDGEANARRPVTFAVNGGPGAASAYLHLGVLGPWRLPVGARTIVPSQPVDLVVNTETWLGLTDLVFIDPVGTGYSRLIGPTDRQRERYASIDGDIAALADFVYRWLVQSNRFASPKYFIGESYGGFRGPLLADLLREDYGLALKGMTLLSPVLDFGWRNQPAYAPLPRVSLLPSLAASAMERAGGIDAETLAAVEAYATDDYVSDLLAGLEDEAATARIVARMAEITGLSAQVIERYAGRLGMGDFVREIGREDGRIASVYDTGVSAFDPTPERPHGRTDDPVLEGLTAPLTSAMLAHYADTLGWLPMRRYHLLNKKVSRDWRWGQGRNQPEAVTELRDLLALDPQFRVLVAHGLTDLVTPYFASELILRQIHPFGETERIRSTQYQGGHMFYTRTPSRAAFLEDAKWLYQAATP